MDNSLKVSVIIPIYNAKKHIKQCLDSLLEQGVSPDFYEIICLNDGSTDDSLSILQEYADKYPNIVVVNKENEGVSATRNKGLDIARGEYVWFIDADDWVAKDFLKNGMEKLFDEGNTAVPLILTKCVDVPDNEAQPYANHQVAVGEVQFEKTNPFMTTNRGHFFSRALIETYQVRFDTYLAYGEDLMFMREFLDAIRFENEEHDCGYSILQNTGKGVYLYRIHAESVMGQLSSRIEKVADSILYRARMSMKRYKAEDKPDWYRANYQEYVHLHMKEYMLYYFPALNKPMRKHLNELKREGLYPAPPPKLGWTKPRGIVSKVMQFVFKHSAVYPLYYAVMRMKFKKAGSV